MAKIEIKDSPDELGRVACFLENNNIKFEIVDDYGNHSAQDLKKYTALLAKFKKTL